MFKINCTVVYIFLYAGEKSERESIDKEAQSHCEGHVLTCNTFTDELPLKRKKKGGMIIQVACGYM